MARPLARVTDPRQLDAAQGPRAELRVRVQRGWLRAGGRLEIEAPAKLRCARCGGGGCDGCGRSGALRAPDDPTRRRLTLTVPPGVGEDGVRLRLPAPFERCAIEQLVVAIEPAERSSDCVRPGARAHDGALAPGGARPRGLLLTAVLALLMAALLLTTARRCHGMLSRARDSGETARHDEPATLAR